MCGKLGERLAWEACGRHVCGLGGVVVRREPVICDWIGLDVGGLTYVGEFIMGVWRCTSICDVGCGLDWLSSCEGVGGIGCRSRVGGRCACKVRCFVNVTD